MGLSKSTYIYTVVQTNIPGIKLSKNIKCQDIFSVIYPPSVGPRVGARVTTRPIIILTLVRISFGKIIKTAPKAVGIRAPPKNPCMALKTIIDSIFQASAHMRLITVKPRAAIKYKILVDNNLAKKPVAGIIMTSAIK